LPTKIDSLFLGAKHYHFYEIDSTNNYALNLLSKSTPAEGCLVTADFQTHGRGQYGRQWLSDSTKNLLSSIILYPDFLPANEQFSLSKAIALAVQSTLNSYLSSKAIRIKWPNDIFCEDKKIGGILIQNLLTGNKINASVIGIGINVNQEYFPDDIIATSVINELGIAVEKRELLNILITDIKTEYMILRQNLQIQDKRYNDLLFGRNEERLFEDSEGKIFNAKVLFVNTDGNLIVERDGKYAAFSFGEIKWL
jgi:BirA family biotin operon repressor/biotin-[acetyl-CoA-carboxylase] ligase